jgi:hypothetical protein
MMLWKFAYARFEIIDYLSGKWDQEIIANTLIDCVVLGNMTITYEYNQNLEPTFDVKKTYNLDKELHLTII